MASTESETPARERDGGAGPAGTSYESAPFTDWREQLRDRVKEIRARKLADKRRGSDGPDAIQRQADQARREKLAAARTRAVEASSHAGDDEIVAAPPPSLAGETSPAEAPEVEDPALEAAVIEDAEVAVTEVEVAAEETDEVGAAALQALESLRADDWDTGGVEASEPEDEDDQVDAMDEDLDDGMFARETSPDDDDEDEVLWLAHGEDVAEAPEGAEVPEFAPYDLADDEDVFGEAALPPAGDADGESYDADPQPLDADEQAHTAAVDPVFPGDEEEAPLAGRAGTLPPPELPAWWRDPAAGTAVATEPPPPDLDAIPEDLKDVKIPAWALPRQKKPGAVPAMTMAEVFPEPVSPPPSAMNDRGAAPTLAPTARTRTARLPWADDDGRDAGTVLPEREPEPEADRLWLAPPATSNAGRAGGSRPASPLDDVYLVGEFATRKPGETTPRRPPIELDEIAPLDALRRTAPRLETDPDGDEPSAGPIAPRGPIPDLYESEDGADVEERGPTPFRGLLADLDETDAPAAAGPTVGPFFADEALDLAAEEEEDAGSPRHFDPSAPVGDRVVSSLADGLVIASLGLLLGFAGAVAAGTSVTDFVGAAPIPFLVAWLLFAFTYGVFFVGTCGQTLGKMVMRVRVIGAHRFEVGYGTAARRALWYTAAAIPAGIGLLPAIRDPEHRALHDRLSGTRVVKA